jgi:septum site-determining protein MinD
MTSIVICMASAKGGSGKTTLTATFAAFLAQIGKKILVVDCDEATHGLTLLYLEHVNKVVTEEKDDVAHVGVFDDLLKKSQVNDNSPESVFSLIRIGDGVDFLPATFSFLPKAQISNKDLLNRLVFVVNSTRERYDYVFLDAQAGADNTSQVAMGRRISDAVIIVSEYDPLSAAGVERLKSYMGDDLSFTRTWILLNKMLPEFVKSFSEFLSVARYLPPVPWTADVVRAYSRRELALDFEVGNQFTLAAMRTLKGFVPHADAISLDKWAERKAASLRQPIEDQYLDQEQRFKYLLIEIEKLERYNSIERILYTTTTILAVFSTGLLLLIVSSPDSYIVLKEFVSNRSTAISLVVSAGAMLAGAIGLTTVIWRNLFSNRQIVSRKLQRERLFRQKELAEAELKRLEALRDADLESIIEKVGSAPRKA